MAAILLTGEKVSGLKKALIREKPGVRSSHLTEAIAAALGFGTNAALRVAVAGHCADPPIVLLDESAFDRRLQAFGYGAAAFRFDGVDNADLISTLDPRDSAIRYRGERSRAWRNLMVCGINEGLQRKLFTLLPDDNRWAAGEGEGCMFDFSLPNGLPARGYVSDAGFAELNVHVAVNPKGAWARTSNGGFHAGDAFAAGWLERKRGAWLQSSTSRFNCRRNLVQALASIMVEPRGFGDRGRVIM